MTHDFVKRSSILVWTLYKYNTFMAVYTHTYVHTTYTYITYTYIYHIHLTAHLCQSIYTYMHPYIHPLYTLHGRYNSESLRPYIIFQTYAFNTYASKGCVIVDSWPPHTYTLLYLTPVCPLYTVSRTGIYTHLTRPIHTIYIPHEQHYGLYTL